MADVAVVDSSPLAAHLAEAIEAPLVSTPAQAGEGVRLVMVASSAGDVDSVARVAAASPGAVGAVVAWHLPESIMVRLLELNVPFLVGAPDAAALQATLAARTVGIDHRDERNSAARYAVLESWLNQPAQPIADTLDR